MPLSDGFSKGRAFGLRLTDYRIWVSGMLVQELLKQLKSSGIVVRLGENGDLAVTAPKGVMTADIARQIKENKQSIVAFLGVSAAQEALAAFPPITPVDRGRFVSISLAQERLWWLEQMFSGIPVHNLLHAYRLRGPLNVAAFEAGLKWVVNRHESLHMRFDVMDGSPVGVIMDDFVASLPLLSLDDVAEAEREDALQNRLREYDQMSFDLSTGPLFRAVLFRLAPEEHVFLFLVHHIIFDGWSADVFWDDLMFAYQTPDPDTIRPSLGIQYVDYAAWQRDWLQSPAAEKELAFWRDTLQEPVEALTLPVSRQASGHLLHYEAQQQPVVVPPALAAQVKTLAQQNKATPFMVLLAAYKATLHAYTGQEDMIVCTPSVGRTTAVLESQVGYFNNILVFRSNLGQDPTFIALLKREKQAVLSANEHQATPFQHLAELPAVRNVPLMRAMFVLQTHLKPPPGLPGLQITPVPVQHGYDYADMSLELTEENGAFSGMMWFKSALFEADHMAQFVENYLAVLAAVTAHPERPLSALPRFELPVVVEAAANGKRPFTAPRDAAETELAAIWGEMLAYEPVSVYDNFFDVGGHSLLAIRLFDRIEAVTGVKLPLSLLFRAATIADLAAFVRDDAPELAVSSLVSLTGQDEPAERPFYCAITSRRRTAGFSCVGKGDGGETAVYWPAIRRQWRAAHHDRRRNGGLFCAADSRAGQPRALPAGRLLLRRAAGVRNGAAAYGARQRGSPGCHDRHRRPRRRDTKETYPARQSQQQCADFARRRHRGGSAAHRQPHDRSL
jgi:acyl carrier protein